MRASGYYCAATWWTLAKNQSPQFSLFPTTLYPYVSPCEQGWHTKIPVAGDPDQTTRSPWVSQRCYYAYQLHPWILEPDTIFCCGRLFQQYIVNA